MSVEHAQEQSERPEPTGSSGSADVPPVSADVPPVSADAPPAPVDAPPAPVDAPPAPVDAPPVPVDVPPVPAGADGPPADTGEAALVEPTEEPDTPPDDDPLTVLAAEVTALRETLDAVLADRRAADERARAREQVIAHQRDELDALRVERRGGHLRPLVVGLQKLRAELLADAAGSDASRAGVVDYYAECVLDVLDRCGCHPVAAAVGDELSSAEHRIVRTAPTDADGHGRIVAVLAEGWVETDSGRVLAPAKVVVGRHVPPEQDRQTTSDQHTEASA